MVRTCLTAATAALLLVPAARAADVRVVNERGIPQAAMWTDDDQPPRFMTDIDGWIRNVEPGKTLRVTRSTDTNPCYRNPGGAPEGAAGVSFAVTEAGGTITLPNATGPSYKPESSDAERWIVGKVNERRAQNGKPPVRVSAVLNRVADAVARKQAAESLSFPPPFCPVVVVDWGFPGRGYGSVDANGTDPRKAWEHWSDGSVREMTATLGDWNAVGVGDGGGAWTAYFANCPPDLDARCEMSSDQGDPSISLPSSQTQTPPTAAEPAVMGKLTFAPRQRGRVVKGTVEVGRAGSAVAVRLKRGTKILGKLLMKDVAAGSRSLRIALNHSGKKLLKAKKRVALTVEVVVDPPTGDSVKATRSVKLRR
jgi:hypothetical protein